MRFRAARAAAAIVLALLLASSGVVPCGCVEMSATQASDGHCGPAGGSGAQAWKEACACACMTASDEESAPARFELVSVRGFSVVSATHAVVRASYEFVPPPPLRRSGHSPPPAAPSILRI